MPDDRGFPRPDLTLVFDGFAARHLEIAGAFPPQALAITGSPGLDRLAARVRAVGPTAARRPRRAWASRTAIGPRSSSPSSPARALAAAPGAAVGQPGRASTPAGPGRTRLVVKPHPAETDAPYRDAARPQRGLAPGAARRSTCATLLAACDLVVTVNSTVAIDAMALGIPALSVGMPNNLTPFVVAGGIAGVYHPTSCSRPWSGCCGTTPARAELVARGRACAESGGVRTDGGAAAGRRGRAARPGHGARPPPVTGFPPTSAPL